MFGHHPILRSFNATDHNVEIRRCFDVDVVQTTTGAGNHFQPAGAFHYLPRDAAGNWPMTLEVSGLPPLPDGETYSLWLRKDGALADSCGSFVVAAGTTTVPLNAPYRLRQFDDWVIVRTGSTRVLLRSSTI